MIYPTKHCTMGLEFWGEFHTRSFVFKTKYKKLKELQKGSLVVTGWIKKQSCRATFEKSWPFSSKTALRSTFRRPRFCTKVSIWSHFLFENFGTNRCETSKICICLPPPPPPPPRFWTLTVCLLDFGRVLFQ